MRGYFDYFPASPKMRSWGLYATSFGQVRVPPYSPYPPSGHPKGHHFEWKRGRTLQEYQILYISDGSGVFESALTKPKKISPGTLFLLFPGVWHRYRPDSATGWTESWIELSGSYLNHLIATGIVNPKNPIYRVSMITEMEALLETTQQLVEQRPPQFLIRMGFYAMQMLTLLDTTDSRNQKAPQRINRIIADAQAILAEDLAETVSAEELARSFGTGYSYFRREFKRQTGYSPMQYRIEIRYRQTRDLLSNSSLTIKEIAERLGYYSPYHLSHEFSKRMKMSPTKWRVMARRGHPISGEATDAGG